MAAPLFQNALQAGLQYVAPKLFHISRPFLRAGLAFILALVVSLPTTLTAYELVKRALPYLGAALLAVVWGVWRLLMAVVWGVWTLVTSWLKWILVAVVTFLLAAQLFDVMSHDEQRLDTMLDQLANATTLVWAHGGDLRGVACAQWGLACRGAVVPELLLSPSPSQDEADWAWQETVWQQQRQ